MVGEPLRDDLIRRMAEPFKMLVKTCHSNWKVHWNDESDVDRELESAWVF